MKGRVTHQGKCTNLEPLNGIEELLDLKFRKIDHLITSVGGRMTDNNQRVYMALWQ